MYEEEVRTYCSGEYFYLRKTEWNGVGDFA
jgi:hypothetical protein